MWVGDGSYASRVFKWLHSVAYVVPFLVKMEEDDKGKRFIKKANFKVTSCTIYCI